jgi:hypothetical protein
LIFCATVFSAADRHAHPASDLFYNVFPFFAPAFLMLDWIGGRTSGQPREKNSAQIRKNIPKPTSEFIQSISGTPELRPLNSGVPEILKAKINGSQVPF